MTGQSFTAIESELRQGPAERLRRAARRVLKTLDFWRPAYEDPARLRVEVSRERQRLEAAAFEAGLERGAIDAWLDWGIQDLVRADLRASAHQGNFFFLVHILLGLPVFAVFVAGGGIALEWLANDELTREGVAGWARAFVLALATLEFVALVVILGLLSIGRGKHLHHRWIENRYDAERIRAARFLSLVGGEAAVLDPTASLYEAGRAPDNGPQHMGTFWKHRPPPVALETSVEALRCFLVTAWLHDQVEYQRRRGRWHATRHHRLGRIAEGLAIFALVVTAGHVALLMVSDVSATPPLKWMLAGLVVASIVVPATVAGVNALSAQHEHERNAARCHSTSQRLQHVEDEVRSEFDRTSLARLAEKAAWLAVSENHDWFDLMRFHDLELHI
jgi:hypothetical protein